MLELLDGIFDTDVSVQKEKWLHLLQPAWLIRRPAQLGALTILMAP